MDDESKKEIIANTLNSTKNLGLNVQAFKKAGFYGAPFSGLAAFLSIPEEARKGGALPGIPAKDSTNSEIREWMSLVLTAYAGQKANIQLKGDNAAKYPAFKTVIDAFKKNDILKFQMITNPESIPVGSELWKSAMKGEKRTE